MENSKALIVDDSKLTQKQLAKILTECAFANIDFASDGAEALTKFKAAPEPYNLITLDITMPQVDGVTVLKQMISHDNKANIIMVSALGRENVIGPCMAMGAKNFIVKPFDANKVKEIVMNIAQH